MKKILAIDDQKNNLIAIKGLINNLMPNCKVLTALSGKEGLKIARKEQPDTILLDIIMPEMDGYKVCEKLKKDELTKHIPIIMLTAIKTDTKDKIKGLNAGADAFFTKPIEPAELSAQVNVMLRIKEVEDKLRAERALLDEKVIERTKELRDSERQLQSIFDDPDTFIGILELDGSLIRANKAALKFIDSTNPEVKGIKFWETPWWTHSQELQEKLKSGIVKAGKGEVVRFEADHFGKDGNHIVVNFSIRPVRDLHDKIYTLIVEGLNITDRKQAEDRIKESEEKYRKLIETTSEGVWIISSEKKTIDVNQSLCDMLGYSRNEIVGRTPFDFVDELNHEIFAEQIYQSKTTKHRTYEISLKRKNGINFPTLFNATSLIDKNGEPAGSFAFITDITERKQAEKALRESEERYRTLTKDSPISIIVHSEGKIVYVNPAALELIGASSEDELLGRSVMEFVHPDYHKIVRERVQKIYEQKNAGSPLEEKFIRMDGKIIDVEVTGKIINFEGKIGSQVIIQDITKRKKAEQELIESEKRLKELNASKDKFFSIIGHDLINPFGLVMSAAEELSKDYDNYNEEDRKKLIEIISKDSKHAMNLLQNLLEWSRSQRGLIKYNPERFFIKEIIDENIRLFEENAGIKQIKLRSNIPPTLIVYADKNIISIIIRNLLSNAIKFTEKGTIELSSEVKNNQLHISIIDSGIGIEKQLIDKLFKIDDRISTVGTSGERGTGLGLNLCKDFINKNKGEIWVESTVGKGSKFTFSVPIKP